MISELKEKTERVVSALNKSGLAGVILNSQPNFSWITGGASNAIDQSRENGAGSIMITASGEHFIVANNIEMPRLTTETLSGESFGRIEFTWQDEKAKPAIAAELAAAAAGGPVATDLQMFADVPAIDSVVATCRYSLTSDEVVRYRALGSDASEAIGRVINHLRPGQCEIAVAEIMRHELAAASINSVVILVAGDGRIERFRHPVPTANVWRKTLLMVTCAKRDGLIVSLSRIISSENPSVDLMAKTHVAAAVHSKLIAATRPGATAPELYRIAASAYSDDAAAIEIDRHHQGGATGYRTRDWVAHPGGQEVVQNSQAFAWNPSLAGTKVEETCIVGPEATEVITRSNEFPEIRSIVGERELVSAGILVL